MEEQMMLQFVSFVRPYAELLYFISSIGLLVTAIYALKQLSLSKKTLSIQSLRDSAKISSDQCDIYFHTIINYQNILDEKIKKERIMYFEGWQIVITDKSINIEHSGPVDSSKIESIGLELLNTLNAMESFSNYFTSGIADERLAYYSVGTTFIHSVENYIPQIIMANNDGHYRSITELYLLWKNRYDAMLLSKQKEDIGKKLRQKKVSYKMPIGVNN
jgi:hypothetical protein